MYDRKSQAAKEKTHMSTLTIDAENNVTAHAVLPADADESQSFSTAKELAKLTAEWPASRLVETWNSFVGSRPSTLRARRPTLRPNTGKANRFPAPGPR